MDTLIAVDWGRLSHAVYGTQAGTVVINEMIRNHIVDISTLVQRFAPCTILIECAEPHVVDAWRSAGASVLTLTAAQSHAWRSVSSVSGAKDDRRDAQLLLRAYCAAPHIWRPAPGISPTVVALREIVRGIMFMRRMRLAGTQRLQSLAESRPGIRGLDWTRAWTWDLLSMLHTSECTSIERRGKPLDLTPICSPQMARSILTTVPIMATLLHAMTDQEHAMEKHLHALLMAYNAEVPGIVNRLLSCPGLGEFTAAILIGESGGVFDYKVLRCISGMAPITVSSGTRCQTRARKKYNRMLRHGVWWMAFGTLNTSPRCRAHYDALRKRGLSHGRALRGVADRYLRAVCAVANGTALYEEPDPPPVKPDDSGYNS